MKILTDLTTRDTKEVQIKKTFEFKGETFAVIKNENNWLKLYYYRSGEKMPSCFNHKKTIKDFTEKALEAVELIYNRNPEEFFEILNKQETLNN